MCFVQAVIGRLLGSLLPLVTFIVLLAVMLVSIIISTNRNMIGDILQYSFQSREILKAGM